MNKQRREQLDGNAKALAKLMTPQVLAAIETLKSLQEAAEEIKTDVESIRDEEQESHDNMPESLQQGEKGQQNSRFC